MENEVEEAGNIAAKKKEEEISQVEEAV